MGSFRYKLLIAYDGTAYSGWQVQLGVDTIQGRIQEALAILAKGPICLIGAGRTDAGVHATGQVAHFQCTHQLCPEKVRFSLNGLLPKDIRILHAEEASSKFHAQHSAKSKIYHYSLSSGPILLPLRRFYCTHLFEKLDFGLLKEAASLFVGRHDFTAFANSASKGSAAKGAVRDLYRLDVIAHGNDLRLEFEASGFLYKMVRNIVGTLIEVATRKRSCNEIPRLFEARDRRLAGKAADPQGLCLVHVNYTEPKSLECDDKIFEGFPLTKGET